MLDLDALIAQLARFADLSASEFEGWPTHRRRAREHWARAFAVYVRDLADADPVLDPPGVTLVFDGVERAFLDEIELDRTSHAQAATDFASAWRAALLAITPGDPAVDPDTSSTFEFLAFEHALLDSREQDLRTRLTTSFAESFTTRRAALVEIATALHEATVGLRSTPNPFAVTYE